MNLTTLAKLAGVSVSTVSKAFNGSSEISADTKEHIFEIAREHNCFEKYFKNKYSKKIVAVIYPEMQSDYYTMIVDRLEKKISEKGAVMVSSVTNFNKEREQELFHYYASYSGVDGIIMVEAITKMENPTNVPLIVLSNSSMARQAKVDYVQCDLDSTLDLAIETLKKLGHTRIGFAGELLTSGKLERYKKAMRRAELVVRPADIMISEKRFEAAGVDNMEEWLKCGNPPTAVLAAYDYIAVGLAKSIHNHGMSIPEDFSIIGMDDIPILPYMRTSLSSIKTHTEEACQVAVDTIMKKIDRPYYSSGENIILKTELILRDSVGPCPVRYEGELGK